MNIILFPTSSGRGSAIPTRYSYFCVKSLFVFLVWESLSGALGLWDCEFMCVRFVSVCLWGFFSVVCESF